VAFTQGGGEYALPWTKSSQAFSLKKQMQLFRMATFGFDLVFRFVICDL